jgi:hypothetical protein
MRSLLTICTAALLLMSAVPASARPLNLSRAAEAARSEAAKIGEVDNATCWRAPRRSRRRAFCVVWWVTMSSGSSCTFFYDARLAGRRFVISERFDPWCSDSGRV